jgi:hypothetical protein
VDHEKEIRIRKQRADIGQALELTITDALWTLSCEVEQKINGDKLKGLWKSPKMQ